MKSPGISISVIVCVLSICLIHTAVFADLSPDDINRALQKNLVHPYLYFTDNDKAEILERIDSDPDFGDIMKQRIAESNRLLYTPVEQTPPARVRNARYNASYEYEGYITGNSGKAYDLAFVYQMTGEKKYAQKAFEFADVVCNVPTWVHGAHEFPQIYDRVWPWGAKDDQVVFNFAQWSDHVLFQMAAIYDWLYPALDKRQRDRIRGAMLEKAILRVRGNYEYHWWAASYRCNWCTVCNASLGVAAISLLTEDPQLTDVIAESHNRISKTLDEIRDGGWQEGLGYLSYTVRTSLEFANVLKRATGGKLNLYKHPRFHDAIKTFLHCQIPPGRSVHFGDSGSGSIGNYNMLTQITHETGNTQAAWLLKHCTNKKPSGVKDLFMPKSTLEPELPEGTASIHFPSVDWVILRSDFTDKEKVVIAAKSAPHNDPHHGHLDSGHFSLFWRGREFITDQGSAGYDRKYFDKERWDYPLASNIGHNTVLVNGERQLPGKVKNEPWNEDIGGKIVEFRPGKNRDYALMDQTNAHPQKEMKSWRRHIILDKPEVTVVLDEVVAAKKRAEIEARFHSSASFVIKDTFVLMNSTEGTMALIPVVDGDYRVRPGKHAIMMAQKNAKFRWAPYFGTVISAQSGQAVIGTIILPVDNEKEAKKVAGSVKRTVDGSDGLTVSFKKDGKKFTYSLKEGDNGLILE